MTDALNLPTPPIDQTLTQRDGQWRIIVLSQEPARVHTPHVVRQTVLDMTDVIGNLIEEHVRWFASAEEARAWYERQRAVQEGS